MKWTDAIPWGFMLAALVFGIYQYVKRRRDKRLGKTAELEAEEEFIKKKQKHVEKTCEDFYSEALRAELGNIDMLGSPDIESKTVKLSAAFVSLRISEYWRSETRFGQNAHEAPVGPLEYEGKPYSTPEEVMNRAFQEYRLLLIIGDPGSGKTTLMKYYAMHCLDKDNNKCRQLGFSEQVLPIYFPLRELEFLEESGDPVSLPDSLAQWAGRRLLDIPADQFHAWLQNRNTLVLLDGLDEIGSKEKRRKVCRWIKNMSAGLKNSLFVVTSRATGYRKLDGVELQTPHLRADIMDFSIQQQEEFLQKWFRAVFLAQLAPPDIPAKQWQEQQSKLADLRSRAVIEFLKKEENKAVRDLAAAPMLLQIMAILWQKSRHIPETRLALYDAALNYLLVFRDKHKEIDPLLPVEEARRVLAPTALWMHETLKRDETPKEKMHEFMQPILNNLAGHPKALAFCEHLRDRAGLIADYDRENYIFRHKSFREYLAGIQLEKDAHQPDRVETLIAHFKEDWWDETLRFFMGKADAQTFDRFMRLFFQAPVSEQLNDNQQTLLQNLVKDALEKKIDALAACLNNDKLSENRRKYVLDCLKTVGAPGALAAIAAVDKSKWSKVNRSYAEDIVAGALVGKAATTTVEKAVMELTDSSFRNPFEDKVEYIKIPGGTYKFSDTGKIETIPDLYFCKYLVTNKRYRKFISYLEGKEKALEEILPLKLFTKKLLEFAGSIKEYSDYLGKNSREWGEKLRSRYDDDKKFNGGDQPVVEVTWYAARAYCLWLSYLQQEGGGGLYRLPTEVEWEWAAAGREPGNKLREYPWPTSKGEPSPELANYGENVGATTPVGRYPEGATPEGLMDMAGNAWEWMDNWYDEDKKYRVLRGGSWITHPGNLRFAARDNAFPRGYWPYYGFRVVCEFAPSFEKLRS
ncbi:MAG: SUMF1/EgtB/PvdO family nonheme iron enzyme [Candidatus Aminicenantes bacterium]|nr:SUMF1/EgtB/PvdO family nonheme iron enzyme [Candidatus Aminicenantes bacterium]